LSFAEAPQVLPVKNLLFKLQIFGNTEEYPEGHKHRLPVRVKRHGCPSFGSFLGQARKEQVKANYWQSLLPLTWPRGPGFEC